MRYDFMKFFFLQISQKGQQVEIDIAIPFFFSHLLCVVYYHSDCIIKY